MGAVTTTTSFPGRPVSLTVHKYRTCILKNLVELQHEFRTPVLTEHPQDGLCATESLARSGSNYQLYSDADYVFAGQKYQVECETGFSVASTDQERSVRKTDIDEHKLKVITIPLPY